MTDNLTIRTGVALVTPFINNTLDIDFDGLTSVIKHIIEGEVDNLIVLGSTAEAATLTKEEKKAILAHVKTVANGRVKLVAGIGGNNTAQIIKEIEDFESALDGYDSILSVSPSYNKPSQDGIIAHYTAIADASKLPIVLYNVPARTGSNMLPSTTLALMKHKNIIGIKESSGNLEQIMALCVENDRYSPDFQIIAGDDLLFPAISYLGGTGVISVIGNAYPFLINDIQTYHENDMTKMDFIIRDLKKINDLAFAEGNPTGIKAFLEALKLCSAAVRLPLLEASPDLKKKIKKLVAEIKK